MATVCKECGKSEGKFRYISDDRYVCIPHCGGTPEYRGERAFPLVTSHGSGHETVIENMRQLRAHERQHGIISHAFNQDQGGRKEW